MLSTAKRKEYFEYLGLGEYTEANIRKLQKKYLRSKDVDGKYGNDTDRLLASLYKLKKYAPHFAITEFKCHCGGKYCTGYPAELDKDLLINLEKVRSHFGKPVSFTSALRCKTWNSMQAGSASGSRHTKGKAVDINCSITDSSSKRAKVKSYWLSLPESNYSYYGTSNMGNSVHVDVK